MSGLCSPTLVLSSLFCTIYAAVELFCRKVVALRARSSEGKGTNVTPVSLLEIKVTLPTKVIFGDEAVARRFDPSEVAQLPKTRLGEGTLGTLFKVVLNCGSIITVRKIRDGLAKSEDIEFWVNFFGRILDPWLLSLQFSFWYGGEAFIVYEYFCLGSLEELLHGSEGIQFTPLTWDLRKRIALCSAMALASIHTLVTKSGNNVVCGVIKSSNILVRMDFSACLSGYEIPYLVPPATIIKRNPGRVAPELTSGSQNLPKMLTCKSDVYSFGILLLELLTGKRPMVTHLAACALKKREIEALKDLCDQKMGEVTESMIKMFGIARQCISYNPRERPPMARVVKMLQELED